MCGAERVGRRITLEVRWYQSHLIPLSSHQASKRFFANEPHSSPTFFPPQNQSHRLPPSEPNTVSLPLYLWWLPYTVISVIIGIIDIIDITVIRDNTVNKVFSRTTSTTVQASRATSAPAQTGSVPLLTTVARRLSVTPGSGPASSQEQVSNSDVPGCTVFYRPKRSWSYNSCNPRSRIGTRPPCLLPRLRRGGSTVRPGPVMWRGAALWCELQLQ